MVDEDKIEQIQKFILFFGKMAEKLSEKRINSKYEGKENMEQLYGDHIFLAGNHLSYVDILLDAIAVYYLYGKIPFYLAMDKLRNSSISNYFLDKFPVITVPTGRSEDFGSSTKNKPERREWVQLGKAMTEQMKEYLEHGETLVGYLTKIRSRDGKTNDLKARVLKSLIPMQQDLEKTLYVIPTTHSYDIPLEFETLVKDKHGLWPNLEQIFKKQKIKSFTSFGTPIKVSDLEKDYKTIKERREFVREEIVKQRKLFPEHLLLYILQEIEPENIEKAELIYYLNWYLGELPHKNTIGTFEENDLLAEIEKAFEWANKNKIIQSEENSQKIKWKIVSQKGFDYFANTAEEILEAFHSNT